jgi:hypothetical protein
MFSASELKKKRPAFLLAAAILTSSCVHTGKSKTYAPLLDKGGSREIHDKLEGTIESNSQVIRELEQKPVQGWLRFAVIGDSVSRRNGAYRELLTRILALDPPPAFVVNLGDFTRGRAEHYSFYFDTVKGYPLPLLHVIGNHDEPYPGEMIFRTVFGARDFSFDYGDARFIFMGSEKLGFTRHRLDWLEDKLKAGEPATKIFISHEYMFEAYPELFHGISLHFVERITNTSKVLDLLDKYDVPLAVAGHLHRYYEKIHRGTVLIITGGGGQSAFLEPRARQPLSTKAKHFTVIDLPTGADQELRVAVSVLDRQGAPLFPTSFYRWETNGDIGAPSMRPMPPDAFENDPTLPAYVLDLYERSRVGTRPATSSGTSRTSRSSG